MKRNLIILTVVGALLALAAPASSMAAKYGMFPAGHNFEINGQATPLISGPLAGYCEITKITGTVPAAPKNEANAYLGGGVVNPSISAPTFSCGSGMSATAAGEWKMNVGWGSLITVLLPANGLTVRYSSLPGCKLVETTAGGILGTWSNGTTSPAFSHSGFSAANLGTTSGASSGDHIRLTWQQDGTSACALEGSTEELNFRTKPVTPIGGAVAVVTDTTNPAENIILTNGY